MKFRLGRTPSAPKRKDLEVTHRAVHSLLSQESWACNDYVCVPLRGRELALRNFELRQRPGSSSSACRSTAAGVALHLSYRGVPGSGLMSRFPRPLVIAFPVIVRYEVLASPLWASKEL